jgi:hypothetical protein
MGGDPAVIEVRLDAAVGVVECEDLAGAGIDIGVSAAERTIARRLAGQAVDTAVVVGAAAAVVTIVAVTVFPVIGINRMVDATGRIGERAEVIVEGMLRDI